MQIIDLNGNVFGYDHISIIDANGKPKTQIGGASWGDITGSISSQTDLQNELNNKQNNLVSGTNIKTINGNSVLGSGDLVISGGGGGGGIQGLHALMAIQGGYIDNLVIGSTSLPSAGFGANYSYFAPFIPAKNVTISDISCEITSATAGGQFKILVYEGPSSPNNLIIESSFLDNSTTGFKTYILPSNITFNAGSVYWFAVAATTSISLRGASFNNAIYKFAANPTSTWPYTTMVQYINPSSVPSTLSNIPTTGWAATPIIIFKMKVV